MTGKFKLSNNLFLGLQELQHFYDFLKDKTLLLKDTYSFGIIKSKDDPTFLNFKIESGTNSGTVKIATDSFALDSNGDLIYKEIEDNIALTNDNSWYWAKIKYLASPIEVGTVSVDNQGILTGINTKFTEILRGQPNFPSKIKLIDASLNVQEYLIQEILSDVSAILLGTFTSENNLHYAVVGTFTPGISVPSGDKFPMQYDSCTLEFIPEVTLNTAPVKTDGLEFYVSRVKRNGSSIFIEDKRNEFWKTKSDYDLSNIDRTQVNPLIGVESIKFDNKYSDLSENIVTIGFGMRSTNWVINSELRRITIISCVESGKYKDVSQFIDNDFNGWRIYSKDGSYKKIVDSTLSGGQINLILNSLDPDDYTSTDELVIVPDVESIQIRFRQDAASSVIGNIESIHDFPISQGYAVIKVLVPVNTGTYKYNVAYRYKNFANYNNWQTLPTDTSQGFYDESSFDSEGVLKTSIGDRHRKTYTTHATNGFIELISNGKNYFNVVSGLTRGDTFGVARVNLNDTDKHPVYQLTVGASKQVQIFGGSNSLAVDWFISLVDGLQEENEFFLVFENVITLNTFHLRIVENYVSTSVYDQLIDFSAFMVAQATAKNLVVRCTWDGTNWQTFIHISASPSIDISGKADKVTGATNGNFAGLDASGNLTDSGHKHSDYDAAGAAGTAQSNAEGYADGLAGNYDSAGAAGAALTAAESYADGVGSSTLSSAESYADGVATNAENNAKSYTDGLFSPVWSSFSLTTATDGTLTASTIRYIKIGKIVFMNISIQFDIAGPGITDIGFSTTDVSLAVLRAKVDSFSGGNIQQPASPTLISGVFKINYYGGGSYFKIDISKYDHSGFAVGNGYVINSTIIYEIN
jgi:hypothetical protein